MNRIRAMLNAYNSFLEHYLQLISKNPKIVAKFISKTTDTQLAGYELTTLRQWKDRTEKVIELERYKMAKEGENLDDYKIGGKEDQLKSKEFV